MGLFGNRQQGSGIGDRGSGHSWPRSRKIAATRESRGAVTRRLAPAPVSQAPPEEMEERCSDRGGSESKCHHGRAASARPDSWPHPYARGGRLARTSAAAPASRDTHHAHVERELPSALQNFVGSLRTGRTDERAGKFSVRAILIVRNIEPERSRGSSHVPTVTCPLCRRTITSGAEHCPHCHIRLPGAPRKAAAPPRRRSAAPRRTAASKPAANDQQCPACAHPVTREDTWCKFCHWPVNR
jgi:hypothetical protein